MGTSYHFSPTLLVVSLLSVAAGAGAGLLSVGSPAAPPISVTTRLAVNLPSFVVVLVLLLPLVALLAVFLVSSSGSGGSGEGMRSMAVLLVLFVLLGLGFLVLVIHPAALAPIEDYGRSSGPGNGGGASGGSGPGNHSGPGNGTNGSGTNGSGGNTSHGGNGTNNSSSGGSGSNNSTNRSGGSGGNGSSGGNGGGRGNNTTQPLRGTTPPSLPQWMSFAAVAVGAIVVLGLVLPRFAARQRGSIRRPPPSIGGDPRAAAAAALSAADRALTTDADPRNVIGQLYRNLIAHVAPVIDGPVHQTPEEVRDLHLLPMGVRPVAAQHLTRLFEEASYSSHPLGSTDVARAREAIQLAELDLRSAHAAG